MIQRPKELIGIVVECKNYMWEIHCPDAPDYLQTQFVRSHEIAGSLLSSMRPGLRIRLVYVTSNCFGLWMATEEVTE